MMKMNKIGAIFMQINLVQYLLLIALLFFAGALHLYLGEWSFGIDEIKTNRVAQELFSDKFNFYDLLEQQSTLLLIGSMLSFFAVSEWNARLVPTLVGTFSILIFYFPIRKMFSPIVALMTGFFLALSPWHLYWSQNAHYVCILLLFSTLALFFTLPLKKTKLGIFC